MNNNESLISGEEWKEIHGYENIYMISSLGRIKNVRKNKITNKLNKSKYGITRIKLYKCGVGKLFDVRKIVANHFIPIKDKTAKKLIHLNLNYQDCSALNLKWVTEDDYNKWKLDNNIGNIGEKMIKFKAGLPVLCEYHGEHDNWRYNEKFKQICCKYCANERANKHKSSDNNFFKKWIQSSKRRTPNTDLTIEYLAELYLLQGGMCKLSGIDLNEDVLSLDRINSDFGYFTWNVQWMHIMVNKMKSNFEQSDFIEMCKLISENHNKDRSEEINKVIEKAESDSKLLTY